MFLSYPSPACGGGISTPVLFSFFSKRPACSIDRPMPDFTPHQDDALKAVSDWMKAKPGANGTPQVFRLFGYAGTGKTTLARYLAEHVDGEVKFAAFTGKAASVMRGKGCKGASTIHSLIYLSLIHISEPTRQAEISYAV